MPRLLTLLTLMSCIEDAGPGPRVGDCADYPDSVYTWGEIGIGSCLSGPTNLAFHEDDEGTNWLAVVNANPYLDYSSGSLLFIDFDSIDFDASYNALADLTTATIPLENFSGGLGLVPERGLALVPTRFSEGSTTQAADDELQIIDISEPRALVPWSEGSSITLRDDPQPVVYDPGTELAYVVNLTDHTVSVIDTTETPLALMDVAGRATVDLERFFDADGSGSRVELVGPDVEEEQDVPNDTWTLTWGDGTYRLWVAEGGGLVRYTTGLGDTYAETATGVEVDPAEDDSIEELHDPFLGSIDGYLTMYFEDEGQIKAAFNSGYAAEWSFDEDPFLSGSNAELWDAEVSAPSVLTLDSNPAMYYDGRVEAGDEVAAIGLAISDDGFDYSREYDEPLVEAPDGFTSVEDPFVREDGLTGTYRMWVSLFDGTSWSVGLTESLDGFEWDEVTEVLSLPDGDIAAPVITWAHGRYLMWASSFDGTAWDLVYSESSDGITWSSPEVVVDGEDATDFTRPPRAALQASVAGTWTVDGDVTGALSRLARAGATFYATESGWSMRIASGFELGTEDGGWYTAGGVQPSSIVDVDGVTTLYATAFSADGTSRLVLFQDEGDGFEIVAADLVPEGTGGNVSGVSSPVVYGSDGAWTMVYAAADLEDVARMYLASSSDGLTWTPGDTPLLEDQDDWDAAGRVPHSLETLSDGTLRLWYAGSNGSRERIGSATSTDGASFAREPGEELEWQFSNGAPGEFDDTSVTAPMVIRDGDTVHLYYAGFDGDTWRIGYATREGDDGEWEVALDASGDERRPVLFELDRTFSAGGVGWPTGRLEDDGEVTLYYGGLDIAEEDGGIWRIGRAGGQPEQPFVQQHHPTPGDTYTFRTTAGDDDDESPIDLTYDLADGALDGTGMSSARLDEERGFLYLFSKRAPLVYVLDVRDDSIAAGGGMVSDANYLSLEAVLVVTSVTGSVGFRDGMAIPGTDLMYALNTRSPALLVMDLSEVEDDDDIDVYRHDLLASLPLQGREEDAGANTYSAAGPMGLTLSADGETLFAVHMRDNSLSVFDLGMGSYGEEVAYLPNLGENPHTLARSPDGTKLFVANYLGEVDDETGAVSSTLAVVDIDPDSDTYLEAITWIGNR